MRPTRLYLKWLGILVVIVAAAYFLAWNLLFRASFVPAQSAPGLSIPASFPKNIPAPAPTDYVAAQTGFQYLVSYTNHGFAPHSLSVKRGETIRFTNNSAATLQLSLPGSPTESLAHAGYFEHTFDTAGTFNYSDGANVGTVTVK